MKTITNHLPEIIRKIHTVYSKIERFLRKILKVHNGKESAQLLGSIWPSQKFHISGFAI